MTGSVIGSVGVGGVTVGGVTVGGVTVGGVTVGGVTVGTVGCGIVGTLGCPKDGIEPPDMICGGPPIEFSAVFEDCPPLPDPRDFFTSNRAFIARNSKAEYATT